MTFQELIKSVVFDNVWTELNKEYGMKNGAFEAYLGVFNQLNGLMPEPDCEHLRLAVVRIEDEFEPGTFIFDVFGIKHSDHEHYALELSPWKEWLSYEVIEKCIDAYGAAAVVAHSLHELTFFGYEAADVEANTKSEIEILSERREEIASGAAALIPWDEACKSIGYMDTRTTEEKELLHKQFERIAAENKRVCELLLS